MRKLAPFLIFFAIGCGTQIDNSDVASETESSDRRIQSNGIEQLISQYAEWKKIPTGPIEVGLIDSSNISIGCIEANATLKTQSGDFCFKLWQGDEPTKWAIMEIKNPSETKFHGVNPPIDLKVIDARKHLNF